MTDLLLDRLDLVRRRLRRVHLLAGSFQCLLALLGLLASFFVLDWLVLSRTLEGGAGDLAARAVLMLAVLGLFGWVVWRTIVAELRTERDDDQIALRVERSHPTLRGRLISTVQLTRSGDEAVSSEMISALEEETVSFAEALDFSAIINRTTLKRAGLAALFLVALAGALGWWQRDYARALVQRMTLSRAAYPTAAVIVKVSPLGLAVGRGEPVTIEIELDPNRQVPDDASAALRLAGGKTGEIRLARVLDAPAGKAIFRGTIDQALDDFDFRPAAYDARWPSWEQVRVRQRPALKAISILCAYPKYLGRADETTAIGDLRVPAGTRVTIHAALTKSVQEAAITQRALNRGDDGVVKEEQSTRAMELDAAHGIASTTLTIDANGGYAIALKDRDGFANAAPISFTVSAIPDRAPTVTLQFPHEPEKSVSKFGRWPIKFTVRDDHGIAKARLMYTVVDAEQTAQGQDASKAAADAEAKAKAATKAIPIELEKSEQQTVWLDIGKTGGAEGQRITYWIEAEDNREPLPNLGKSMPYGFTIVDQATLAEEQKRETERLLQEVKEIRDRQKDQQQGVRSIEKAAQ